MFIYTFLGEVILQIYTNDQALIDRTLEFLPYVVFMPILSFMAYLWDGVFVGMTAIKALRNITIWSTTLFIVMFYIFKDINFSYALWISFMAFFLFRGLFQTLVFFREGRELT